MCTENSIVGFCGLYCGRCVFFHDGEVKKTAEHLENSLKGYDKYAERMSERFPELRDYPRFMKVLSWFAGRECRGCRLGGGFEGCLVRECSINKENKFCYQCDDFPCAKMHEFMIENSRRIKEIGLRRYIAEEKPKIGFQ